MRRHTNLKVLMLDSQPTIFDPEAQSLEDEQTMDYKVSTAGSRLVQGGQVMQGKHHHCNQCCTGMPHQARMVCNASHPEPLSLCVPHTQAEFLRADDDVRIVYVEYKHVQDMEAAELAALAAQAVKVTIRAGVAWDMRAA